MRHNLCWKNKIGSKTFLLYLSFNRIYYYSFHFANMCLVNLFLHINFTYLLTFYYLDQSNNSPTILMINMKSINIDL